MLCDLFKSLSRTTWHAILNSRLYSHPRSDGLRETSVTDFLLNRLYHYGRYHCVIYAPREITSGADLDLILLGRQSGSPPTGMHFRVQAKKLNRREEYTALNKPNKNGYQADLLCSAAGFYPLYLFYNCYLNSGSPDRQRLSGVGCTIASARRVRGLINPGPAGNSVLALDALLGMQQPWWTLVCRGQGSLAARARQAAGELNGGQAGADDGDEISRGAYRELEGPYRQLWELRGAPISFFGSVAELQRPAIILAEPSY